MGREGLKLKERYTASPEGPLQTVNSVLSALWPRRSIQLRCVGRLGAPALFGSQ